MAANPGNMIVGPDAVITASIRNCRRLEVYGYVDGDVIAESVVVHQGGKMFGAIRAGEAEVLGTMQGNVTVKNLIAIRSNGIVNGNVRYGSIILENGGELAAELRNVPPHLAGDFALTVVRGGMVKVTPLDLSAVDPDNTAGELTYTVSNEQGGHVAFADSSSDRITSFTQADVDGGRVSFVQDGGAAALAKFDVVVTDASGAASGAPRTVDVTVVSKAG